MPEACKQECRCQLSCKPDSIFACDVLRRASARRAGSHVAGWNHWPGNRTSSVSAPVMLCTPPARRRSRQCKRGSQVAFQTLLALPIHALAKGSGDRSAGLRRIRHADRTVEMIDVHIERRRCCGIAPRHHRDRAIDEYVCISRFQVFCPLREILRVVLKIVRTIVALPRNYGIYDEPFANSEHDTRIAIWARDAKSSTP